MKHVKFYLLAISALLILRSDSCENDEPRNESAIKEQAHTELNQSKLNQVQAPPDITWSLERDNLIKRFKLQNDRAVMFYMYVFIEGANQPIGYYQINKVSSVNSQLTNPMQIISGHRIGNDLPVDAAIAIPSPAEDGSYGENGNAVFGFTPDDVYIETNMKYIVSTIPLAFREPVNRLAIVTSDEIKSILATTKKAMR